MSSIAETWFQDGLEKGLKQGLEKGREEGREEGLLQAVLQIVTLKFGEPPPALRETLATYDASRLNDVLTLALDVRDLDEFMAAFA